jgi:type IV secretion system protein VirB11
MIPARTATATASIRVRTLNLAQAFSRFLRTVNSGHPGSITTVHADSAALAFEQLTLLVRESEGGRDLPRDDIRTLLHLMVDVVVQMKKTDGRFLMTEVWHDPLRKRRAGD